MDGNADRKILNFMDSERKTDKRKNSISLDSRFVDLENSDERATLNTSNACNQLLWLLETIHS